MPTEDLIQRQLDLELESVENGVKKYREALQAAREHGGVESLNPEAALIRQVLNPYLDGPGGLSALLRGKRNKAVRGDATLRKYLKNMRPVEVAYVVIRRVLNSGAKGAVPLERLSRRIGTDLMHHAGYLNFKTHNKEYFNNVQYFVRMKSDPWKRTVIKNRANTTPGTSFPEWPTNERIKIGTVLLSLLTERCHLGYTEDIFPPGKAKKNRNPQRMWVMNPDVIAKFEKAHGYHEIRQPEYFPIVIVNHGSGRA